MRTARRERPFIVMAKPVGSLCNMRCSYCYYLDKGKYSRHKEQRCMGNAMLEQLVIDAIAGSEGPQVSFIWHGGEPTLAGIPFYQKAVELQHKYLPRGWEAWNNLQTNGLLLDDRWCAFLKKNRFDVGLSIDGSEAVHDANRRDAGGKGTWARVRKAAERLQKAGIQPDLLCTVNAETVKDPLGVYKALRELGTGWIQFIPIVVREGETVSDISVTGERYGEFLCTVFDEWIRNDLGRCDVQLFAETARVMAGGEASLCWMSRECGNVLIAEEDGSIYSCDHFVDGEHRLGTLGKGHIAKMAQSPEQAAFGRAKYENLTKECKRCEWLMLCNGACPKDRFDMSEDGEKGQYYLCKGLKRFFSHARDPMRRAMDMSAAGRTPEEIMKAMREG